MGIVGGSKSKFASLKSVRRFNYRKVALFVILGLSIGFVMFWNQADSVKVANIVGGVSAAVAIAAAVYVFHPRLNYWLLPRKTRREHDTYVAWLTLSISNAHTVLAGSRGKGGERTEALRSVHLTSGGLAFVPPSVIDFEFGASQDDMDRIARFKKVAEAVIGTEDRTLEDPRMTYQLNLLAALGQLLEGVGYELGGHGYVTDVWAQNLGDWVVCVQRQYRALKRPLGSAAAEGQLLNLLDRLYAPEFTAHATEPLREGDLVRIRTSEIDWTGTLKLTSDPEIVYRRESGLAVWRLEVVDAVDARTTFICDRTTFEPAPGE